jgi:hypothetical protein
LRGEAIHDLQFHDDDDPVKTTKLCLTEFTLKAMTLGACPTKRQMSRDEELEEAREQS